MVVAIWSQHNAKRTFGASYAMLHHTLKETPPSAFRVYRPPVLPPVILPPLFPVPDVPAGSFTTPSPYPMHFADRWNRHMSEGLSNMTVRHTFEPNAGYRFYKEEVSLLLHAAARFKQAAVITNYDMLKLFQRLNRYLKDVGAYDAERQGVSNIMTSNHFPDPTDVEFFKFMPKKSLEYYLQGSLQLGSIEYYRTIEQQNSKDSLEGLSNIAVTTRNHLFAVSLASGYNFGILCGTATLNRRTEMSQLFGTHIIKIRNLKSFAEDVKSLFGAKRYYFNRDIYNDLKMFRMKTLKSIRLSRTEPPGNFDPDLIGDNVFDLLYEGSFLPSLFIKPTRFSIEEELRLVFEMPTDVPPPHVLRKTDEAILKHIEVI
jgi:hypothetical protein